MGSYELYMSAILHDPLDTNPPLPCTLYILYLFTVIKHSWYIFAILYWDQVYNDSNGYWSDLV